MKSRAVLGVVVAAGLLALTGCASIVNGSSQRVGINSIPSGASVKVLDGDMNVAHMGTTPCSVKLDRGDGFFSSADYSVIIEKDGYHPVQMQIRGSLGVGWYLIGNLFSWDIWGWLILDPLTGAMWNLEPERVNVSLMKK
jgi:hypothetical protein